MNDYIAARVLGHDDVKELAAAGVMCLLFPVLAGVARQQLSNNSLSLSFLLLSYGSCEKVIPFFSPSLYFSLWLSQGYWKKVYNRK